VTPPAQKFWPENADYCGTRPCGASLSRHGPLYQLVARLGESIGLAELAPDADGGCSIAFDGRIAVELRHDPSEDALVLFCALGELDDARRAALAGPMLESNLSGSGPAARRSPSTRRDSRCSAGASPWAASTCRACGACWERFIDAAESWRNVIDDAAPVAEPDPRAFDPAAMRV
jgi:hypothetical protein